MRTTTYRAPDKRQGYTGGEVAAILYRHAPNATLIVRVGWKGQPQQLIVTEPDQALGYEQLTEQRQAEIDRFIDSCETPPQLPPNVQDMLTVQEIARATEAEELVREELRAEGVDVHAVERAARRAQQRGLGGAQ